jgi:hypothetical protein
MSSGSCAVKINLYRVHWGVVSSPRLLRREIFLTSFGGNRFRKYLFIDEIANRFCLVQIENILILNENKLR